MDTSFFKTTSLTRRTHQSVNMSTYIIEGEVEKESDSPAPSEVNGSSPWEERNTVAMIFSPRNTALTLVLAMVTLSEASIDDNKLEESHKPELSKKSRFISFNNDAGEVKIELDFAVPFMKIPTSQARNGVTPLLNVNANGLVTVGAMLFLFVTVVPKVVQLFMPQATVTATENLIPLMGRVDEALRAMDIPTTDCYQRSACWIASNSLVKYPFAASKSGSEWLESFIENEAMQEAFRQGLNGGDCATYKCPLSMNAISQIIKIGRSLIK